MVKEPGRLTVRGIAALKNPGRHADGGNLYVLVGRDGKSKHFVFMYRFGKRQREAGLGPTAKVTLAQARREAAEWREMLRQGIDPLAAKKAAIEAARAAASKATFGEVADDLLRVRRGGWGARHAREWRQTMVEHAAPLWTMPVDEVDTDAIVKALKPVWSVTPDVGRRVRQRVEGVLAAAQARGLTPPDRANPARWRGLIENLLPRPPTLPRGHYRSMPYGAVPGFFAELRAQDAAPARALAFIILTAARINEAIAAEWSEIDIAGRVWTIPANRMKARKPHRVPLTEPAIEILKRQAELRRDSLVFPGFRSGRPVATTIVGDLARDAGASVHGFRSSFRDWAAEQTTFPRELAELSLAHAIGTAVEQAYLRSDLLERRRELMAAWAEFCNSGRIISN